MKILIPIMNDARLEQLHQSAPGVHFLMARSETEALAMAADVDASYTYCSSALLKAAPHRVGCKWRAGRRYPLREMHARGITFTNAKGIYGTQLADHTLALILAFSRQLPFLIRAQQKQVWENRQNYPPGELAGQTLLIVGLGGAGLETARRAKGFGLRILAMRRHSTLAKPDFVDEVHPPERLHDLLPEADWVAVCVPLVPELSIVPG
jgi:phosphoglycerate dehydrogenase-like enzyme